MSDYIKYLESEIEWCKDLCKNGSYDDNQYALAQRRAFEDALKKYRELESENIDEMGEHYGEK